MKTNRLIKTLLTALLLAAAASGTQAASLLADGTFDNLPVGTKPDTNAPAGHWNFLRRFAESAPSRFSITPSPAGGAGNALRVSIPANENVTTPYFVTNGFARAVTAASREILDVSFDLYIEAGAAGPSIFIGKDPTDPYATALTWSDTGEVVTTETPGTNRTILQTTYPKAVWQTVRLEMDIANNRYNFYSGEKGQPASVVRSDVRFNSNPPYDLINTFFVGRFAYDPGTVLPAVGFYIDNIQVSAGPPAAVTPAQSFVAPGGSVTLSPTNTLAVPSTYQWRLHGTNLPGATSATLALSNLSLDRSGPYSVIVSNAYEVVTATAATVQVVTNLLLLSQPQSTNVPAGSNVTLSVTALSPSPITYQWQFNGTDLPGQTGSTLALTNVQFYPHTGDYRVRVSDTASNVWSEFATLLVLQRPVITNQPVAQTVLQGGTAVFSVTGGPDHPLLPLVYRWLRNGVTWASNVPPTLVITNCQTNGFFRCQLINAAGNVSSTVVNLTVLPDFDADGMADAWEKQYGFDTNHLADAALDFDGDGMSNRDEYNAGTNPTNAASVLKLQLSPVVAGQAVLSFLAMSNRTYTVEWNAEATGGTWNRVQDVLAQPAERIESVSDTNASGAMRLYRVVTPKRP